MIEMKLMAIDENSPSTDVYTCSVATLYDDSDLENATTFLHLEISNCSILEMKRLYIGILHVPAVGCNISDEIELSTWLPIIIIKDDW